MEKRERFVTWRRMVAAYAIILILVTAWGTVVTLVTLDVKGELPFPLWAFPVIWVSLCAIATSIWALLDWAGP